MPALSPEVFFRSFINDPAAVLTAIPQSGSARQNFIGEAHGRKFVLTKNENTKENRAFLYFSEIFSKLGLNTPHIFRISDDEKMYIQEFCGSQTLAEIISREGMSKRVAQLVKNTLHHLFILQRETKGRIDFSHTFEYEAYNRFPILHDLFYFKFMFADVLETEYHKLLLLKEFEEMANIVSELQPRGLMLRDFQSRNIIVNDSDEVSFIDYQSAMYGPLMYDVVSFLYQAKANFPEAFREEMLAFYQSFFSEEDRIHLNTALPALKMMRFLQVLGAYGFRGLVQGKSHFLNSIPQGISNLFELSQSWGKMQNFPELLKIINQINSTAFRQKIENRQNLKPLIK